MGKSEKWVACWGTATSITDRKPATYSKNLTLRYPILMPFSGSFIRIRFSNETGTEPVILQKINVSLTDKNSSIIKSSLVPVTFNSGNYVVINPGDEVISDEIRFDVNSADYISVTFYLENFTQMNSATRLSGPLSKGYYAYGDYADSDKFPVELSRETNWFWFLNTIDILTDKDNHAIVCYGDSITAQSWPDYLALRCIEEKYNNISIIRRAVSGTRILREYDCITYQAYGQKGEKRFRKEMNVAGAKNVIIQHGINDIIHPVGIETNIFRPWSDLPTSQELIDGVTKLYLEPAKELSLKVWSGTLLPIYNWRTYADFRNELKNSYNDWLRTSAAFEGCIDFDYALRDPEKPEAFLEGYDSGDHLHPSELAYKKMAEIVPLEKFS